MKKYVAFILGLGATFILLVSSTKPKFLSPNGKSVAKFLMRLGYSKENAAGIAGNLYVESRFNPTVVGDSGTSFGIAQWHKSRWERLIDWGKIKGLNINTLETQLKFIDWELNNTERLAKKDLIKQKNARNSAFSFAKYYERPQVISQERMNKAEEIYKSL